MNILFLAIAYLLGSIPFGLIICKTVKGVDPRSQGSKNIGATNVGRIAGKRWGVIVFLLDVVKGFVAVMLPFWAGGASWTFPYVLALGIAVIAGHSFPVWLRFKGGKGVATSLGAFLAIAFLPALLAFGVWILVFFLSRTVSVASLVAVSAFPVIVFLLYSDHPDFRWLIGISAVLAGFIFWTHRTNIVRILRGEEKKNI